MRDGTPTGQATTLGVVALRLPTPVTASGYVIDSLANETALVGGTESDARTTINAYDPDRRRLRHLPDLRMAARATHGGHGRRDHHHKDSVG
jgi:hypothetical protein